MLLQCSICQTRQDWEQSPQELTAVKDLGAILAPCQACVKNTYHVYPSSGAHHPGLDRRIFGSTPDAQFAAAPPPAPSRGAAAPSASVDREESRGPRRVKLELPLRVRSLQFGFEEVTTTVNVSRGGVYFHSERAYGIGQHVKVQLNYSSSGLDALEQSAEVARVQIISGSFKKGVALKYL
jgi:hypothetical protein